MEEHDLDSIIDDEIVVDAYNEEEIASAWYSYMEDNMHFPFKAECIYEIATSPLKKGEQINVVELGEIDSCNHGIYVKAEFMNRRFDLPLAHLRPTDAPEETLLAVQCWYHWLASGNQY